MGFHFYSGNKLENLAELFWNEVYSKSSSDSSYWLTPEVVITQTKGIADWLKQKMASKSIAINISFPFINNFMGSVFRQLGGEFEEKNLSMMSRDQMTWDIFKLLDSYKEAEKYISGNDLKKFQLAQKLAELFDQYQIYHGEQLEKWRNGECYHWFGELYQRLAAGKYSLDQAFADFAKKVKSGKAKIKNQRISVFGVSAMPESYFGFFKNLAKICEVHFFYLAPCGEYWEDTITPREAKRICDLPRGNQLLATLGVQGRNFHRILNAADEFAEFEVDDDDTMLQRLQKDIWSNRICGTIVEDFNKLNSDSDIPGAMKINPYPVDKDDHSIVVHNCHTTLREVEVLHDQLLDLLQNDPELQPQDIIVMTPNIAKYEPFIRAVFGSGDLKRQFSLCDRSIRSVNQVAAAFLALLELCKGRFEASAVLDLLEFSTLKLHERLGEAEIEQIRDCIINAGIRWGINGNHRRELCGVEFDDYSWQQGLDRLLAGYALDPENSGLEADIVPADSYEGNGAVPLGEFIQMVHNIFRLREKLSGEYTLIEWSAFLLEVLANYFSDNDEYYLDTTIVRDAIVMLGEHNEELKDKKFSLEVIRYILENNFGDVDNSEPFLQGKITFCSMLPMRSIPMEVVAVLGLNDGEFPRNNFTSEFNIVPINPGKIDRSPNLEDRFMFLEAILAARKYLLLFYQGRDGKNNSPKPPALPLVELMDQIRLAFNLPKHWDENGQEIDSLEKFHKLQAFDFDYFYGEKTELFSYSQVNRQAAAELQKYFHNISSNSKLSKKNLRSQLENITIPEYKLPEFIKLDDLEDFFISPQAMFLKRNGNLILKNFEPPVVADEEPFSLFDNNLYAYDMRNQLAKSVLDGKDIYAQYSVMQKSNLLPVGENGWQDFDKLIRELDFLNTPVTVNGQKRILKDEIARAVKNFPLKATLSGNISIVGVLSLIPDNNDYIYFYWRAAKSKTKDLIRWYLRHLLLAAAGTPRPADVNAVSMAFFMNQEAQLLTGIDAVEAKKRLGELLEIYRQGQSKLSYFFPEAGYNYATTGKLENGVKGFYTYDSYNDRLSGDWSKPEVSQLFDQDEFEDEKISKVCFSVADKIFMPFINKKDPAKKGKKEKK